MSFLNYIPGVAHAKALTHLVFNDKEGAERTMETFHTKTPIVSHLLAGIAKVAGEDEFAKKCWDGGNSSLNALPVVGHVKGIGHYVVGDIKGGNKAMVNATSTTLNMADGIPVVGHAKGIVHYVCGDVQGGNKVMRAATRSTVVMGAGAGGFLVAGPVGAVAGGTTAGAEWDLVVAAVTDGKEVNGIAKIVINPKSVDSYFDAGMSLIGDGMTGYSGGKIAQEVVDYSEMASKSAGAEQANAAAQQLVDDLNAGKINWDQYKQKWDEMKPNGGTNNVPVADGVELNAEQYNQAAGGNMGKAPAAAQQLVENSDKWNEAKGLMKEKKKLLERFESREINWDELRQQKEMLNSVPESGVNAGQQYNQAVKEIAKEGGKTVTASSRGLATSTEANGNQPPQRPYENKKPKSVDQVLVLRQRLTVVLRGIQLRIRQDTSRWSPARRRFHQRESFRQIYTIVSELLSNGYSATQQRIQQSDQSNIERIIPNLVISSPDGSWKEVIKGEVADYQDVHDQLIGQQFPLNPESTCPTALSAIFDGLHLVLSPQVNHGGATNVIYGIRCRICDRRRPGNRPCDISYVGQTTRSVHKRVCGEHASAVTTMINNGITEDSTRPMYEHAVNHFHNDLPENTQARDAFRLVMEEILLPIGDHDDLRSWESFWQFFLHCRGGWSQR